jgi:sugar phosphate isomerase/epimerase
MSDRFTSARTSRRSFLAELAALGGGGGVLAACTRAVGSAGGASASVAAASANAIGLQLYTVRDRLQQDFEGTLEEVARVGYTKVEFAGYYNRTPEQVRALLDRLKLTSPSSHIGVNLLRQDLAGQIAMAKTIGHEYVTAPSYPLPRGGGTLADWRNVVAEFNKWGAACRAAGLRFAFHNHAGEFAPIEGRPGMDILLRETDPALVDFELDLYWARFADQDPLQLFERYPGRFAMWHVKDMREPTGSKAMAPVGQGEIDFRAIFARARQSGLRHFFVEHDNAAQTGGSLESIRASHQHLRQILA